ncbi:hypothetical protein Pcinc_023212 [Petrolisthes cinctipes]|uniref:C2H2-type domain-containing protein n=1 Tax=Petrolisthes cinctipes TaxID=88211 RepID=A0AAE1FE13_PETCI|nr:hypothetical protein Pcinc_023212 [Petrolisthes cinctipes]
MASCALCHEVFPSKVKLVHHFSEAHSIARQRTRRQQSSKGTQFIRHISTTTDGGGGDGGDSDVEEVFIMDDNDVDDDDGGGGVTNSSAASYSVYNAATTNTDRQLLHTSLGNYHQCSGNLSSSNSVNVNKKQPVPCKYCGQLCKDRRGAAIHHNFCERKNKDNIIHHDFCKRINKDNIIHHNFCERKHRENIITVPNISPQYVTSSKHVALLNSSTLGVSTLYECPGNDCGAIFKSSVKLSRHILKHHSGEDINMNNADVIIPPTNDTKTEETTKVTLPPPLSDIPPPPLTPATETTAPPLVTVTMKPHIGKTEGLQDLSLLITPTKPTDEFRGQSENNISPSSTIDPCKKEIESITVEECHTIDDDGGGDGDDDDDEAVVLYIADDGSVLKKTSQPSANTDSHIEERTFLLITRDGEEEEELSNQFKCSVCNKCFISRRLLLVHMEKHADDNYVTHVEIKLEPEDYDEDNNDDNNDDDDNDDEDWEMVTLGKRKNSSLYQIRKNNVEYKCSFCKRNFLSELGYQTHIKNKECRTKKFKLPRMFSCHFSECDASYFKLTELQRHWQIAHKFSMASKTLQFDDDNTFTEWLAGEEEKYKVRFTCDVKRRKPHRTERLLVCHRFHHLRTAAARKNARRQYSDKHNWVHKIQPCLCFARMKVYQDFNDDACDYTGKISVVYYHEHSHTQTQQEDVPPEILDHILQRNKRKRNNQFQDLKGSDKHLHRQKLERFARLAGKEYRPMSFKATTTDYTPKKVKREPNSHPVVSEDDDDDQMAAVSVANNLLGGDELFATQVEMVLDGQFDMGHEVLSAPVVTHLDSLTTTIFAATTASTQRINNNNNNNDDCETTNQQSEEEEEEEEEEEKEEKEIEEEGEEDTNTTTTTTMQALLPATPEDWQKLFEVVRNRVSSEGGHNTLLKAEAELLLPYQRVINLISPNEQIPIFRQLWDLAYTTQQQQQQQVEMTMVK